MKKLMLLCGFALLTFGVGLAQNSSNAAIVINHGTALCGMPGSDANGNITFGGTGTVIQQLQNNNKVTILCKGTGILNESGTGQSFSDFGCGVASPDGTFYLATDSQATVSASGVATLRCTFQFN